MKKPSSASLFILLIAILGIGGYWWNQVQQSNQHWDTKRIKLPDRDQLQQRIEQQMQDKQSQMDRQIGVDLEQLIDQQAMQAKLSGLTKNITLSRDPTEAELSAFFEQYREQYRETSQFAFKQLLFSKVKYGGQAIGEAKKVLNTMANHPNSWQNHVQEQLYLSSVQLDELYGQGFSDKLLQLAIGNPQQPPCWSQPITSIKGAHLLCFEEVTLGAIPKLESVRSLVTNHWRYETAKLQSPD